jgi:AcrR family transcriptional regulator
MTNKVARGAPRPPSREDKQHETSLRVQRSAVSLVLEHGFDHVTVDMICSQSGISQRTFFNYFKTKTAAIIGPEPQSIDETRARAFIAAPGADLLPDVLVLMSAIGPRTGIDEQLFADRVRVFGMHPQLMQQQMERMFRVTSEVGELVYLRLGRESSGDAESDADRAFRHDQAQLLTHAMLGVVRFMAAQWVPSHGCPADAAGDDSGENSGDDAGRTTTPTLAESLTRTIELLRHTLGTVGL